MSIARLGVPKSNCLLSYKTYNPSWRISGEIEYENLCLAFGYIHRFCTRSGNIAMAQPLQIRTETEESLLRMQQFDPTTLPREKELGSEVNFLDAIEPAIRLVDLYKRLAVTALDDLSQTALQHVKDRANADYSILKQALEFQSLAHNRILRAQGIVSSNSS